MKKKLIIFVKGFCVGGTMLVPGVSGGSMAMILGIYNKLISAVSSFMKNKKANAILLGLFSSGAIIGMIAFAKPLLKLIEKHEMVTLYFFIGAVIGGLPMIFKKAKEGSKFNLKSCLYLILGAILIFSFSLIPEDILNTNISNNIGDYLLLLPIGIFAAVALVLPGISVSYVLLLLGVYDQTMEAISNLNIGFLAFLGIGVIIGIILTTRLLEKTMEKYPHQTYLTIVGFIIASVGEVFPGIPSINNLFLCLVMLVLGFLFISLLSRFDEE